MNFIKKNSDGTFELVGDTVVITVNEDVTVFNTEDVLNDEGEVIDTKVTSEVIKMDIEKEVSIKDVDVDTLKNNGVYELVHDTKFNSELHDFVSASYKLSRGKVKETIEYTPKTIEFVKTKLLEKVENWFNLSVKALGEVNQNEKDSWFIQVAEAESYAKDNTVNTPLIDSLLVNRTKYDKDTIVAAILKKSNDYKYAYGNLLGKYQSFKDTIDTSTTVKELENVKVV